MNIADMHVYFRQYAQQMGMQNVRAIIPEQIDILINTAIVDVVNKIVRDNVGVRNDKLIKDYSKIGNVDALRTLSTTIGASCGDFWNSSNFTSSNLYLDYYGKSPMYILNCDIIYSAEDTYVESLYPIRLIDNNELSATINDPILKPKLTSPIGIFYNNLQGFTLYLPKKDIIEHEDEWGNSWTSYGNYVIDISIQYLAYPAKVSITNNVDCDLSESLHVDIVKYAAELYKNIVSKGSYYQPQQPTTATNK